MLLIPTCILMGATCPRSPDTVTVRAPEFMSLYVTGAQTQASATSGAFEVLPLSSIGLLVKIPELTKIHVALDGTPLADTLPNDPAQATQIRQTIGVYLPNYTLPCTAPADGGTADGGNGGDTPCDYQYVYMTIWLPTAKQTANSVSISVIDYKTRDAEIDSSPLIVRLAPVPAPPTSTPSTDPCTNPYAQGGFSLTGLNAGNSGLTANFNAITSQEEIHRSGVRLPIATFPMHGGGTVDTFFNQVVQGTAVIVERGVPTADPTARQKIHVVAFPPFATPPRELGTTFADDFQAFLQSPDGKVFAVTHRDNLNQTPTGGEQDVVSFFAIDCAFAGHQVGFATLDSQSCPVGIVNNIAIFMRANNQATITNCTPPKSATLLR